MSQIKKVKKVDINYLQKSVHINHIWDGQITEFSIRMKIAKDSYSWYLVYEMGYGNFARIHLISSDSADSAISSVWTYIKEEVDSPEDLTELKENFPITGYNQIILQE